MLSLLPECQHGAAPLSGEDICVQFVKTFRIKFCKSCSGAHDVPNSLLAIHKATEVEFVRVWCDPAKMESVISRLLGIGAQYILDGIYDVARDCAVIARYGT